MCSIQHPPPAPTGPRELQLLPWLRKRPQASAQHPARSQTQGLPPGAEGLLCLSFPLPADQLSMTTPPSWPPTVWPPQLSLPGAGLTGAGYKNELKIHINPPV